MWIRGTELLAQEIDSLNLELKIPVGKR